MFRFFGNTDGSGSINGAYFCTMVKRDIDEYILNNTPPLKPIYRPMLRFFNVEEIPNVIGKPIQALDVNMCYFQTAYNLGYVSEKTYKMARKKISEHNKIKQGLTASIGSLNKLTLVETYKDGVKIDQKLDYKTYDKYSPFYWRIIKEVYDFLTEAADILQKDFYMAQTDCIYFNVLRKKEIYDLCAKFNYKFKLFTVEFKEITDTSVTWFDHKDQKEKTVNHINCDIWKEIPKRY
jgi:hypothetical protein